MDQPTQELHIGTDGGAPAAWRRSQCARCDRPLGAGVAHRLVAKALTLAAGPL
jgi:hypothetical protein